MIIKGHKDNNIPGRRAYPLEGFNITLNHFVVRECTPTNPFESHKHAQEEIWFIIEGNGFFIQNGKEEAVEPGNMILIKSWLEHGLRSDSRITWICLG